MKAIDFTDKVKSICDKNYKNNCGKCGLRPTCCAPTGNDLNEWVKNINNLAENI
jgi:hypothetical protein